jgi:hypothetical protein
MATELWRWAKEKTRTATYAISGRSEVEKMVLEATNEDKWGPTNSQMQEISRLTFNYQDCESVKKVIWERLGQTDTVRYVQKSLILLEYLLRTGHESFRSDVRSGMRLLQNLTYLQRYQVGEEAALEAVIRKKAQDVINLATDDESYQMEREKANKLRSKVTAVGNAGGFGSSYGSSYGSSQDNDIYSLPSKRSTSRPPRKPQPAQPAADEYEYEDDEPAPPPKPKPTAQVQPLKKPPSTPLGPAPGLKPRSVPQEPFDPYGLSQPQQTSAGADLLSLSGPAAPAAADDLLFGFGQSQSQQPFSQPQQPFIQPPSQPFNQQPFSQPPQQLDLFGGAFVQQPAPVQRAPEFDLLGFDGPASTPAPGPIAPAPAKPSGRAIFDGFDDILDLNNVTGSQQARGRVAQQPRGYGQSLGAVRH